MRTIFVIGGSNIDITGQSLQPLIFRDSNPAHVRISIGGVGHNIALVMKQMGASVRFLTAVGDDVLGAMVRMHLQQQGFLSSDIVSGKTSSSTYLAIQDPDHDLLLGLSDMRVLEVLSDQRVSEFVHAGQAADLLVADANCTPAQLAMIFEHAQVPIACDPISTAKVAKILPYLDRITFFKPNQYEAAKIVGQELNEPSDYLDALAFFRTVGIRYTIISAGAQGIYAALPEGDFYLKLEDQVEVVNASGAGDTLFGSFLSADKHDLEALKTAMVASALTIGDAETIAPSLNQERVVQRKDAAVFTVRKW